MSEESIKLQDLIGTPTALNHAHGECKTEMPLF